MKESAFLAFRSLAFAFLLAALAGRLSAQKALRIKYQNWEEDQNRIRVRSWYAESEVKLGQGWNIGVVGLVDTISGATPIGRPPTATPSDWLVEIEEERRAGIVTLSGKKEDYEFSFEFGLSDEPDYLSRSYAINVSRGFAEDTLSLYGGLSYLDDGVDSGVPGGPSLGIQGKRTPEIMLGVRRILDP